MADFATFAAAEVRAKAKMADGTWIVAHAARATTGGKICVRVQREMAAATLDDAPPAPSAWVEITDDATA
jgi:hypothetical protein